jgi:hypothetical protein
VPPAGTFGSATTQPIRRIVDRVTLRNTGRSAAAAELGQLDRGECLRLLGKSTIGRVVFTEGALPAAHPAPLRVPETPHTAVEQPVRRRRRTGMIQRWR